MDTWLTLYVLVLSPRSWRAVPYPKLFIEASMVLGTLSANVIRQLEYNLPNRNIQLYSTLFWSRQPATPIILNVKVI